MPSRASRWDRNADRRRPALPLASTPRRARERGLVAVVQRAVRFAAQPLQLVGIAQHAPRRLQLLVLAGTQASPVPVRRAETSADRAARPVRARPSDTRRARTAGGCQSRNAAATTAARGRQSRKLVEDEQVALRIEQRLMFVLAVELDERRRSDPSSAAAVTSASFDERAAAPLAM